MPNTMTLYHAQTGTAEWENLGGEIYGLKTPTTYPPSDFIPSKEFKLHLPHSPWAQFYLPKCNDQYRAHVRTKYAPYINMVMDAWAVNPQGRIAELGCGAGFTLAEIARRAKDKGYMSPGGFEPDWCQQELTRHNCGDLIHPYDVFNTDCFNNVAPGWAVLCSHGMLEHWSDKVIAKAIRYWRNKSQVQIHYVPTDKYAKPSFGDERLKSVAWWRKTFSPNAHLVFNDGYDLLLIWQGGV